MRATDCDPMWLTSSELGQAARLCTRAFADTPHIEYFFPNGVRRERDSLELFKMRIRYGLLRGEVQATSPNLEGVAVWIPSSNAHMTMWGQIRAGGMRLYRTVGSDAVSRMTRVGNHNDRLRQQHVTDPYMVLSILAIDPDHQHQGHATGLMQAMLRRLDLDGVSCYAEVVEHDLLAFYKRLGFEPGGASVVPGTDLTVRPLVRTPVV